MEVPLTRRAALARFGVGAASALGAACAARSATAQRPNARPRPASTPAADAAAFEALAKRHGFGPDGPGLAVSVGRSGRAGFRGCYGLADLAGRAAVTPETTFELASVSKTITSTGVLILCERKTLSLTDDVRTYVPELPVYDEARPIRVEDLLRHVSGLPDYMSFEDVPAKHGDYWVNDDYVAEFARRGKAGAALRFPTGGKYEYNNTNYLLLATVIERATKKSFGAFLREAVFGPAGMTDTFVHDAPAAVPPGAAAKAAVGYARDGGGWRPDWGLPPARDERFLTYGDGAIWSNLKDMIAWDTALHAGKLISPETARPALLPTKTADGGTANYGLGWEVYYAESGAINGYGHDGFWGGFVHSYYHEPAGNLTTILLSNRGDFDAGKFWEDLRALVDQGRIVR